MASVSSFTNTRLLHASHFAFLRAVVQGLPPQVMWTRYLALDGDHADPRLVARLTRDLRQSCAVLALRMHLPGSARLLRLDLHRPLPSQPRPSLEEFAQSAGYDDFSEAEQIEAYEALYGVNKKEQARARLLRRQLALLHQLEDAHAKRPALEDPVQAWLPARLHNRLREAGIMTLYGLAKAISDAPTTWTRQVHGIGKTKAQALAAWLREENLLRPTPPFGVAAAPLRATEKPPPSHEIVPGDGSLGLGEPGGPAWPAWPAWRGNAEGLAKAPAPAHNVLGAENDRDAVKTWLMNFAPPTAKLYAKEVERLALWANLTASKTLRDLTYTDVLRYRDFLLAPQPAAVWIGPAGVRRSDPRWRPFTAALSPRSAAHALTTISSLFGFWQSKGYVAANPASGIRVVQTRQTLRQQFGARTLHAQDQDALLEALGMSDAHRRLRLALRLLSLTGMRASELLAACFSDLDIVLGHGQSPAECVLYVIGKGRKVRDIDVPWELVEEAAALAAQRGRPVDLLAPNLPKTPLVGCIADKLGAPLTDPDRPWSYAAFYAAVKAHALRVSDACRQRGDPAQADRVARMSAHWLRHAFARQALEAGMDPVVLQETLGHANLAVTSAVYASVERNRRKVQMQRLWKQERGTPPK